MRVFSAYFWHSEGWTPRNVVLLVAVMKRVKVTTHHWSIACDANMCPEDFEKSLWFQKEQLCVVAPKEASTCRSKGSKGSGLKEPMIMSLRVTASGKISQMKVVEDFESRPHKSSVLCGRERKGRRGGRGGQQRKTS